MGRQGVFEFRTWGGKRRGAGRKRTAARPRVPHRTRRRVDGRTPVHITLRMRPDIVRLRRRDQHRAIRKALAQAAHRKDFRITGYSIQGNHLHLVCEPHTADAMAKGMMSFKSSCAKRLNALVGRRGTVFADRYHVRYLETPRQVRNALAYVLNNWRRHGEDRAHPEWTVDPFSSADLFDGILGRPPRRPPWLADGERPPVAPARFWLLTTGWRRHGLIDPRERPGA